MCSSDLYAWGAVIGAAAVVATVVSALTYRHAARLGAVAIYPIVLIASYVGYEAALFAAIPALGGGDGFAAGVVGHLAFVNAVWLIGLIATFEILHRATSRADSGHAASSARGN